MREITLGFAMCGSFCTFEAAMDQLRGLVKAGYQVIPIMSQNAYGTDTRFGRACDFVWKRRISAAEKSFTPLWVRSLSARKIWSMRS